MANELASYKKVELGNIAAINGITITSVAAINRVQAVTTVPPPPDSIETDLLNIEFDWGGTPIVGNTFYVTSSGAWTLSEWDTGWGTGWLSASSESGGAGTERVDVTVAATAEYREAQFHLECGTASTDVYITQYDT